MLGIIKTKFLTLFRGHALHKITNSTIVVRMCYKAIKYILVNVPCFRNKRYNFTNKRNLFDCITVTDMPS